MNKLNSSTRLVLAVLLCAVMALAIGCAHSRRTAADKGEFTFAQLCDPQIGFKDYAAELARFEQAVRQLNELRPELVVICGDMVNRADEKSFADFNAARARLTMPVYCVPGNHDIGNHPTAKSLEIYRRLIGKDYFWFDHRGVRFVMANTQLWKTNLVGESAAHDAWFKATLQGAVKARKPVVVVCHYPPFEATPDEPEAYFNLSVEKRRELLALFRSSGVVAVLTGHTHKTIINDYQGIPIVASETTSENFDKRPFGFRLWRLGQHLPPEHRFVPLSP